MKRRPPIVEVGAGEVHVRGDLNVGAAGIDIEQLRGRRLFVHGTLRVTDGLRSGFGKWHRLLRLLEATR